MTDPQVAAPREAQPELQKQQNAAPDVVPREVPSIARRLAAMPYEGLLLLALGLIATFPVAGLKGMTLSGIPHLILQTYLLAVVASYFLWLWCHGGQTLPMKTWRFRVETADGERLRVGRGLLRFFWALLFYGPAATGVVLLCFPKRVEPLLTAWLFLPLLATVWWAKFDANRQFLHDRLAGTRLVSTV